MTNLIEKAKEALQPITYEPQYTGYFVLKNGNDLGDSDYCEACIKNAVKEARKRHKERRQEIIDKHAKALTTGQYSRKEVERSKRARLKEYPANAKFTYTGHDPDFGGGLQEPCACEGCGEPFQCSFEANKEEAEHLLSVVQDGDLTDRDKWELDIALYHYQYLEPDVQKIMLRVAALIVNKP